MRFITSKHLKYLKRSLESKHEFSHSELYYYSACEESKGKRRYASLSQDTNFFRNLMCILETTCGNKSEEEWLIKLDLRRILQIVADFAVAYFWMTPDRWYTGDYRYLNCRSKDSSHAFQSSDLVNSWPFVNARFMKIAKEHLPICSVDDFINYEIWT